MEIISAKYLLDQKKKREEELKKKAAEKQKELEEQQKKLHQEKISKIREGLRLSYVAYSQYKVAEKYLADHNFTDFFPLNSWVGTQGLCCVRDQKAYIAFRGTDSWPDILRDATVDLLFIPWYRPIVHFGFGHSWRSVRKEVQNWLNENKDKFSSIAIFGHSLGGAIAHVAALELAPEYDITEVVTFGAPRSSFLSTADSYENFQLKSDPKKTLGSVTLRVVNKLDLVSKVPYSWQGFNHVGKLVYLSADGHVYFEDEAKNKQSDEGFLEPIYQLFMQENNALKYGSFSDLGSYSSLTSKPVFETRPAKPSFGERLLHWYNQAEKYMPLIKVPVQGIFIIIAPFILLAGVLLYLMRSSHSHLKNNYANYFSDETTKFEDDLGNITNDLKIPDPPLFVTITGWFFKGAIALVLMLGIPYLCYWLFTRWTWPILLKWLQG